MPDKEELTPPTEAAPAVEPEKETAKGAPQEPAKEVPASGARKQEVPPLTLTEEAEQLCTSMEKFFRAKLGGLPTSLDMGELRSQQGAIRDLIQRADEGSAEALLDLAKVTTERDRLKDANARAKADFLNYQTRAQSDLKRAEELALRGYVNDLLPIFDSLDLTLADIRSGKADLKRVSEALIMLSESFGQAMKVRGLERIGALGQAFDPARHEAVATRPADPARDEKPGQVVEEFRPGYLWKGLLLRPAQVLVTQADPKAKATEPPAK
jgi:molecular chaperone GrpE